MDQNPDIYEISSSSLDKDDYKEKEVIWVEKAKFSLKKTCLAIN